MICSAFGKEHKPFLRHLKQQIYFVYIHINAQSLSEVSHVLSRIIKHTTVVLVYKTVSNGRRSGTSQTRRHAGGFSRITHFVTS